MVGLDSHCFELNGSWLCKAEEMERAIGFYNKEYAIIMKMCIAKIVLYNSQTFTNIFYWNKIYAEN